MSPRSPWSTRFVVVAVFGVIVVVALTAGCGAPHPPYWTVEKDGKSSTLFGTMHAEVDISALAPELFDKLSSARILITEADVRNVDESEFQSKIALGDEGSVADALGADDFATLKSELLGAVNPSSVAHDQPWFLEGQIWGPRLPRVDPIDATLVSRAAEESVPLGFFETWQDQVDVLNGLGFDDGINELIPTLRDPSGAVDEHLLWGAAYKNGDLAKMTALAFDPAAIKARPQYYSDVVNRHQRWLAQATREIDTGNAFIATGFMHMITDQGMAALLAKRGYTVTQH